MNDYLKIVFDLIFLILKRDNILGILFILDEFCFELLMEKIVGVFMGENFCKGYIYNWIFNYF